MCVYSRRTTITRRCNGIFNIVILREFIIYDHTGFDVCKDMRVYYIIYDDKIITCARVSKILDQSVTSIQHTYTHIHIYVRMVNMFTEKTRVFSVVFFFAELTRGSERVYLPPKPLIDDP